MVKDICQGLSIETNEFAFDIMTSWLYLVLIARFEENSRLSTLTLVTFEVKVALGLESTFTDG